LNSLNPLADLPIGFGMTLVQNEASMKYFSSLSPDQQRAVIDQTHNIGSRDEMYSFVQTLTNQHDL
jgi:hypothetical protein